MIDFRYHLVSIVAVFLALAIGIVLGSTELQGTTIDALRTTSNQLKNNLAAAQAQRAAYQQQESASEQFLQTSEPRTLGALLAGDNVVIITEPGASDAVVNGVKQAAGFADATVTGQVQLQPKFYDLSGATQSNLSSINNTMAGSEGTVLDATGDSQTQNEQQAAQLIANAILAKTPDQVGGVSPTAAEALLSAYAQQGYLNLSGNPTDRATLAVIVPPQSAPPLGANDPSNQVMLVVAQEFASYSAATIVAGDTTGSAQPGSAISALRSSSVSALVSSVDNADTPLGQILVIEALAGQLAGGKPNSYGISGAPAVTPVPAATPSATVSPPVTVTPTPHTTPSGKATKVRNK